MTGDPYDLTDGGAIFDGFDHEIGHIRPRDCEAETGKAALLDSVASRVGPVGETWWTNDRFEMTPSISEASATKSGKNTFNDRLEFGPVQQISLEDADTAIKSIEPFWRAHKRGDRVPVFDCLPDDFQTYPACRTQYNQLHAAPLSECPLDS